MELFQFKNIIDSNNINARKEKVPFENCEKFYLYDNALEFQKKINDIVNWCFQKNYFCQINDFINFPNIQTTCHG